jgi:hypothetical protein
LRSSPRRPTTPLTRSVLSGTRGRNRSRVKAGSLRA